MAVAYMRVQSVSLPHEPRIQKQTQKKEDTKQPATIQKAGKVQTKVNTANTLLLQRCGRGLAYKRMWVCFRAHAHKNK